jgi:sulfite exporter TauE/SafE
MGMQSFESAFLFLGVFAFPVAAGLLSSATHCAAMCGPIHIFLARNAGTAPGANARPSNIWHYHIGRVMTYGMLGVVAGLLAWSIPLRGIAWVWVAVYVLMGLKLMGVPLWPAAWGARYGNWVLSKLRPLGRNETGKRRPFRLVLLGLAAGFLPCATTQAGLAWAVGTADPLTGGAGMLMLGAGTLPLFLAWPQQWIARHMPGALRRGNWLHIGLGLGLLVLAGWKVYGLAFAPAPSCH